MRRKYVRALGAMGLSAALIAAAGCQAAEDDTAGGSGDCGGKIAMFGAYSGPNRVWRSRRSRVPSLR